MSSQLAIALFAEDRAHEALLRPLVERLTKEHDHDLELRVRSARGGHGRALAELGLYQRSVVRGVAGETLPDLLVVAIDANCKNFAAARRQVQEAILEPFADRVIHACPDPHIERWYLADLEAFHQVVGITPRVGRRKCERSIYKKILAQAVAEAGHPRMLGGIDFARELAEAMNFFRAGKADNSLKHFLDETASRLKSL